MAIVYPGIVIFDEAQLPVHVFPASLGRNATLLPIDWHICAARPASQGVRVTKRDQNLVSAPLSNGITADFYLVSKVSHPCETNACLEPEPKAISEAQPSDAGTCAMQMATLDMQRDLLCNAICFQNAQNYSETATAVAFPRRRGPPVKRAHTTDVQAVRMPNVHPTAHMPSRSRMIPPRMGPMIAPSEKATL